VQKEQTKNIIPARRTTTHARTTTQTPGQQNSLAAEGDTEHKRRATTTTTTRANKITPTHARTWHCKRQGRNVKDEDTKCDSNHDKIRTAIQQLLDFVRFVLLGQGQHFHGRVCCRHGGYASKGLRVIGKDYGYVLLCRDVALALVLALAQA
jgi:hypothetical protein